MENQFPRSKNWKIDDWVTREIPTTKWSVFYDASVCVFTDHFFSRQDRSKVTKLSYFFSRSSCLTLLVGMSREWYRLIFSPGLCHPRPLLSTSKTAKVAQKSQSLAISSTAFRASLLCR